jgi:heterodisulfide reductase subunit C
MLRMKVDFPDGIPVSGIEEIYKAISKYKSKAFFVGDEKLPTIDEVLENLVSSGKISSIELKNNQQYMELFYESMCKLIKK